MKYFTKALWIGAQQLAASSADENHALWQKAIREYRAELETIKGRLPRDALKFFTEADLHDGELLEFQVLDGSRPAPLGQPSDPWARVGGYPVRVKLTVLDASDRFVWRVEYRVVRRAILDFPTDAPLFGHADGGFGDWGYDELSDAGDGFLRHEVLFSSGSNLLPEFRDCAVECAEARD